MNNPILITEDNMCGPISMENLYNVSATMEKKNHVQNVVNVVIDFMMPEDLKEVATISMLALTLILIVVILIVLGFFLFAKKNN